MVKIYVLFNKSGRPCLCNTPTDHPTETNTTNHYIGKTKNHEEHRRAQHILARGGVNNNTGKLVASWISETEMSDIGIKVLQELPDIDNVRSPEASAAEEKWIHYGKYEQNPPWPLLNRTDGGEGGKGRIDSPAVRAKRTASRLKAMAKKTPEEIAAINAKIKATSLKRGPLPKDSPTRKLMSEIRRGRAIHSDEFKADLAKRNKEKIWVKKVTVCHPDRPHKANGLCAQCYRAAYKLAQEADALPSVAALVLQDEGMIPKPTATEGETK
jgi:hypothetical protein